MLEGTQNLKLDEDKLKDDKVENVNTLEKEVMNIELKKK
jgi:hypothetical protein